VLTGLVYWRCNWEVALENSMDSHVNYVHRDALVVARAGFIARGAQGEHRIFVGNGFGGDVSESTYLRKGPQFDIYPDGRRWPKTNYRRLWTWLFRPFAERGRRNIPPPRTARWCGGHHLPGMFRAEFAWDLYTRVCVPVEENLTRVWYNHYLPPTCALKRLAGKVAIVTGTSPNIGGGIAQGLADEGAAVACVDLAPENAQQCADWIKRRGGDALGITCDVTDETQVAAMVARVRETYRGVDILVNNAGILGGLSVLDMPLERWTRQIAVNLTGTFLCTKHVGRLMVEQGRRGSIIVIVSTAGHQGQAGNIAYCTSKSGLLNFARAAA